MPGFAKASSRWGRRTMRAGLVALLAAGALWPALAPATVEEQRARLPAPAPAGACADTVQGEWRAHTFYPRQRQWYVFTLHIRREGAGLAGDIEVRGWDGRPDQPAFPACRPGLDDWVVAQAAQGTLDGLRIDFHGTAWRTDRVLCGQGPGGYTLDTFLGTIDPARQEFQSVNRYPIGREMVEDVTVFRRVRCDAPSATPAPAPSPSVAPPPLAPPSRARVGCSCRR
jgi:hypothetical protein